MRSILMQRASSVWIMSIQIAIKIDDQDARVDNGRVHVPLFSNMRTPLASPHRSLLDSRHCSPNRVKAVDSVVHEHVAHRRSTKDRI